MGLVSTYTPNQAINLVKSFMHGVPLDDTKANICDMVNSEMWVYYPWSWSVASMNSITTVDGVQDYTPTNEDILRILRLRLTRTDVTPNESRDLAMIGGLSIELSRKGGLDYNTTASFFAGSNVIRLMLAASVSPTQTMIIQGEYQKIPPRITDATMGQPLLFPDIYFNVFVAGVKAKYYLLSDDPRAGGVGMSKNGVFGQQFSGQYGMFMYLLNNMARTEDLASGDQFQFPEDALGQSHSWSPGLFAI